MSSTTKAQAQGDLYEEVGPKAEVEIQNAATDLLAYAPPIDYPGTFPPLHDTDVPDDLSVVVVESVGLQGSPNAEWILTPVRESDGLYWTVKNVATQKYAWDPLNPPDHSPVYQSGRERLWKIERVRDGHYLFTPRGPKQDVLYWTDDLPESGIPIRLERRLTGGVIEKQHWKIHKLAEGKHGLADSVQALGDLESEIKTQVIVTIQNAATDLFAFAPGRDVSHQFPPVDVDDVPKDLSVVVVESVGLLGSPNAEWILTPVTEKEGVYWTIRNVGTEKFAWDPQNPADHTPVYQSARERLWKIERVQDGHYLITPRGPKEDVLYWTDDEPVSGVPIWLEHRLSGTRVEKQHWLIHKLAEGTHKPADGIQIIGDLGSEIKTEVIVTIQNAASKLLAYAPGPDIGVFPPLVGPDSVVIVESPRLRDSPNAKWILTAVKLPEGIYWTIQNVGTGQYAWDPEDPPEHSPVFLSTRDRLWKIERARDGHYLITPRGPKENILFWTDNRPEPGIPVRLERRQIRNLAEKQHWRIYIVKRGDVKS